MALAQAGVSARPIWLPPLLALAALGASVVPIASGLLLMQDVKLGNFCNEGALIDAERALADARIRRVHALAALPVGGCMALAVAFGAATGATLDRRWRRWLVALLVLLALGGYLAADFTGKKEAWHVLSPGLSGWSKVPLPPGIAPTDLTVTLTHPECEPDLRPQIQRRVAQVYWIHAVTGVAMAIGAFLLGLLGMTWRRGEVGDHA
jgi:hypothetical protein